MDRIILQVPVSKVLKNEAQAVAEDYGFSSLQEVMRVMATKLARRDLDINIGEKQEILTPNEEAVLEKRYQEFLAARKKGKTVTVTSVEEMMKYLES